MGDNIMCFVHKSDIQKHIYYTNMAHNITLIGSIYIGAQNIGFHTNILGL